MPSCRHYGFSLVELLVVIAIIGVLLALILPAVQAARAASRRAACANNLKQIGLAVHNYIDVRNVFPAGSIIKGNYAGDRNISWTISLLPYLDQTALYDVFNQQLFDDSPENITVVQSRVGAYLCPADVLTKELHTPEVIAHPDRIWEYAAGSYRGVAGTNSIQKQPGEPGNPHPYPYYDFSYHGVNDWGLKPKEPPCGRGIFVHVGSSRIPQTCLRPDDVRDGLPHTLMVGERHTGTRQGRRTLWAYGLGGYNMSVVTKEPRALLPDYQMCESTPNGDGTPNLDNNPCENGFGSFHDNLPWLMADGSVRWSSSSIDLQILWNAATIRGGETASSF
jgi:prepilin-type N-terminal cleavage/methylation domain-containing protein